MNSGVNRGRSINVSPTAAGILAITVLSTMIMLRQLVNPGYFSVVHDDTLTYSSWSWQFTEALREGIFYPRWTPLNFWNYGTPTFILYPPLAFYLAAFFGLFTSNPIYAMNLAKFSALTLSGLGMFYLVKEFHPDETAFWSAAVYMLLPLNIQHYYLFGGYASVISLAWFPLILLFTHRRFRTGEPRHTIYAGACYGGLILTHIINAYMFTFVIILFVLYISVTRKNPRDILAIPAITATGFLVSAAYILPLISEKKFISLQHFITGKDGHHYSDFFILPNLTDKLPSNQLWPVYYGTVVIDTILLGVIALTSYFYLRKSQSRRLFHLKDNNYIFPLGIALGSIFLLFGPSSFLWETIPFFQYIQFPARWLLVTTFVVPLLFGSAFSALTSANANGTAYRFLLLPILAACVVLDFFYISRAPMFDTRQLLPAKAVNWFKGHLPSSVETSRIAADGGSGEKVTITNGTGRFEIMAWKSAERVIAVTADQPLDLKIRTFNFPGWTAYLNGVRTEIGTEEGTGAILLHLPRGRQILRLVFVDTPARFVGKLISIGSLLIVMATITRNLMRDRKTACDCQ